MIYKFGKANVSRSNWKTTSNAPALTQHLLAHKFVFELVFVHAILHLHLGLHHTCELARALNEIHH